LHYAAYYFCSVFVKGALGALHVKRMNIPDRDDEKTVVKGADTTVEVQYFINNLPVNAEEATRAIRDHLQVSWNKTAHKDDGQYG
jgi:hypothetical protein